jgi:cell division transport system permease protein
LITVSLYSIILVNEISDKIKGNFILNIFLSDTLSTSVINELKSNLQQKKYTASVVFIDKEEAAQAFIKDTGEDFRKILDYNPIPASILLRLKPEYIDTDSVRVIKKELARVTSVDEIIFEHELLEKVVMALKNIQKYVFIITAVLVLISVYITYSTIKLVISLKREELETMKLVGAKLSSIKMPLIINEIITGIFASVISISILKLAFLYLKTLNYTSIIYEPSAVLFVVTFFTGPMISLIVSIIVLRQITLKI